VVGAVRVAGPAAPQDGREDNHGQEEEDARHFQPQDAAHAAKGAQESTDAARYAPAGLARLPGGVPARLASPGSCWSRCSGLGRAGDVLSNDPSAYPQPDTQGPAYGLRFHSVYDGISDS